ncbi:MAG TPA: tol-pal system protein YbgF [Desulfobacteraceae bacterium]|nr:tol-pal system protein YbgF [Desulfobacteraceae bacterium]
MVPVKQKRIILIIGIACVIMPACSSLTMFQKTPAGDPSPAAETTSVETESIEADKDAQIQALQEKVVLLEDKIKTLESQVAGQKKIVYSIEYSDPAQLYKEARTQLLAGDTDNAADLFSTFVKKHPDHALADNAMYWLGECYYTKGDYKTAATVFKDLVKTYPKAEKVPDALLKTGYAYLSLDDVNRATHFLKQVIKKYPFSPAAEKAQVKLKDFQ